jgi:hypothetical protein
MLYSMLQFSHYADCRYADCHYADCHYAECHYADCRYAECHYAECRYAEGRYADCRYADCHGAKFSRKNENVKAEAPRHFVNLPFCQPRLRLRPWKLVN